MDAYVILTVVVVFTAVAAWANDRFLKLPGAIGVMLAGLAVAGGILAGHALGWIEDQWAVDLVNDLHFDTLLLAGHGSGSAGQGILLGLLLFAGAIQIEPQSLARRIGLIFWLATIGVVLTAVITGGVFGAILILDGYELMWIHMLIFGAILAPTDPVAALSVLRRTSAPVRVRDAIIGESLFNDGVSIVFFLLLIAMLPDTPSTPLDGHWSIAFLVEAGGGIVLGVLAGVIGQALIRTSHRASVVVLVTLGLVLVIGALAPTFYMSCPVACVVAGLIIGRSPQLGEHGTHNEAVAFWTVIEQALTAVLFLLIGLELLQVKLDWSALAWSLLIVPILLMARFVALLLPWAVVRLMKRTAMTFDELLLMTWCGIRGGVSIAMAIAVPSTILVADGKSTLQSNAMVATILVVVASILIQGLTVGRIARYVQRRADRRANSQATPS